jgi:glyoxylase-like metal-dependent hydrolase (beta-lactamase superfamily II)
MPDNPYPSGQTPPRLVHRVVGPWSLNAYALVCARTGRSVLIDPGAEPRVLEEMLGGSRTVGILVTHSHADHIGALEAMRKLLKVPVMGHPDAASRLELDRALHDGDRLAVGACTLRVWHTPGHTSDQICLSVEADPRIFVGDTIFEGGPGKTLSPQDFQVTLGTLRATVLSWPDDSICHPGHGPRFRLGDRRRAIQAFVQKDHGRFCGDATWHM